MVYKQFTLDMKDLFKHIGHEIGIEEGDEESLTHCLSVRCYDCDDTILHTEYKYISHDLKTLRLTWEEYEEATGFAVYQQSDMAYWQYFKLNEREFAEWWELSEEEADVGIWHNRGTTTMVIDAWLKKWPVTPAMKHHAPLRPNIGDVVGTIKELMKQMPDSLPSPVRNGMGVDWNYLGNLFLKDWDWEWVWFEEEANRIFRKRLGDDTAEWQDYEEHTIAEEYLASGRSPKEFIDKIFETNEDLQFPKDEDYVQPATVSDCPTCGSTDSGLLLGSSGSHSSYRCRACGMTWTE